MVQLMNLLTMRRKVPPIRKFVFEKNKNLYCGEDTTEVGMKQSKILVEDYERLVRTSIIDGFQQ